MNKKPKDTANMDSFGPICQGLSLICGELMRRLAPPAPARRHFDSARIEILKGLRALIDARIAQVEKASRKGEKIQVE
jgi:hypothetical protein